MDLAQAFDSCIISIATAICIQVGQIIQTLALCKWEQINPAHDDLYSEFDRHCVSNLVQEIIETSVEPAGICYIFPIIFPFFMKMIWTII